MWIKWKYNDHGHGDFKDLEIPDDEVNGLDETETNQAVRQYLCDHCDIPTWSERYMESRIKWEKLNLTPEEIKARKKAKLQASIKYHESELEKAKKELGSI